jgi:hypothetical protein
MSHPQEKQNWSGDGLNWCWRMSGGIEYLQQIIALSLGSWIPLMALK